ncbi:MarR family winged helix-turn-helix transcriptional regulator [Microbacterium telephonicum]|uniref:DNA-binding MarR family transcriptional regulator n=1 Tax=Microbacterium telephonicum TaxID=1714841 RepID=A0A498CAT5_9MICO|nr:MarR family transcriptional regulator [Microbacterium telephonicum]RLK52613.1 DNA-binding MarR family transcriptional regulator [Microbacterium telephonicum]
MSATGSLASPARVHGAGDAADPARPFDEVEASINLLFARTRMMWRDAAVRVHTDLQPSGYKLLAHIVRSGSANAHQLAELFEMDKSVVSRQVRMLEEVGLLESRPAEHDGRMRVLTPTPAAVALVDELRAEFHARLREVLAGLTPAELEAGAKVVRCLAEF